VKESSNSFSDMKINKEKILQSFIDIKNILNIQIIKCHKQLFNKYGIKSNIAFYIILFVIIFHILVIFLFCICKKEEINEKIKDIYFKIMDLNLIKNNKMEKIVKKSTKTQKIKDTSSIALRNIKKEKYIKNIKKKKDKLKFNHNYNITLNFNNYRDHNHNQKQKKEDDVKTKSKEIIDYIDEELNNLSYKSALKYDKRTYFEYYLSLIKTKHIFIFSFCYNKDYNSKIIKIDLFFMNFIMNYTINALFFNDETMHKIYI